MANPTPSTTSSHKDSSDPVLVRNQGKSKKSATSSASFNINQLIDHLPQQLKPTKRRWLNMVESRCCNHNCPNRYLIPRYIDTEGRFLDGCLDHTVGRRIPEKANPAFRAGLMTRAAPLIAQAPTPFMKKYLTLPSDPHCYYCQEMLRQHRIHNDKILGSCPIHGPNVSLLQTIYPNRFEFPENMAPLSGPVPQRVRKLEKFLRYEKQNVGVTEGSTKEEQNRSDDMAWRGFQLKIGAFTPPGTPFPSKSVGSEVEDGDLKPVVLDYIDRAKLREIDQLRRKQRKRSRRVISAVDAEGNNVAVRSAILHDEQDVNEELPVVKRAKFSSS